MKKTMGKIPWHKSLNGRLVFFFTMGALVMLLISYPILHSVTTSLLNGQKKESIEAELGQISTGLKGITTTLERYINALLFDTSLQALTNRELYDDLEVIKQTRALGRTIDTFLTGAPYLYSVCLIYPDKQMMTFTSRNLQQVDLNTLGELSQGLRIILAAADNKVQYFGNITAADFPLQEAEVDFKRAQTNLLSAVLRYRDVTMIISADENQLSKEYVDIANPQNQIFIVDAKGKITSAYNKEFIGLDYAHYQAVKAEKQNKGSLLHQKENKHIYWQYVPSLDMTLLYEADLSLYNQVLGTMNRSILLTLIGVFALLCTVCLLWLRYTIQPVFWLIDSMKKVEVGDYQHKVEAKGENEFTLLVHQHNAMLDGLETLTREKQLAQQAKQESELKALRNQINPHFLLNTLNTIKWMALMHGDSHVAEAISSLGAIIAPLLRSEKSTCTLQEECKLLDKYVDIMNMRYDGKVVYEKRIDEKLFDAQVLRLMLQPLVENSIVHGFAAFSQPGIIVVEAYEQMGQLIINVIDNGAGLEAQQIQRLNKDMIDDDDRAGVGVRNTNRRIKLNFGEDYGVFFETSPGGGLKATICMPLFFAETGEGLK